MKMKRKSTMIKDRETQKLRNLLMSFANVFHNKLVSATESLLQHSQYTNVSYIRKYSRRRKPVSSTVTFLFASAIEAKLFEENLSVKTWQGIIDLLNRLLGTLKKN